MKLRKIYRKLGIKREEERLFNAIGIIVLVLIIGFFIITITGVWEHLLLVIEHQES